MTHILGTSASEFINGTNQSNFILGFAGNDIINGNNGDDVILAGADNDTASGNNGDDVILGEQGNDTLFGNNGDDVLSGGDGIDNLTGGNGADVMLGGTGNDGITLDRADIFAAGDEGQDTALLTGFGNFDLRGELSGFETISQGSGGASISLSDLLFTTVEGNRLSIDLDGGNDTVNIFYNGTVLDFDRGSVAAGGEVIFGSTGGPLNKVIDFANVEHLNFFNTATGASGNFDFWLA